MLNGPILSIITPVFNGERYIAETVNSVLSASFNFTFEYLVLDDGSTDKTLSILEEHRNYLKIFTHKNMGESATVNKGIENAVGDFILVQNADDPLLTEDLINIGCQALIDDPSLVAIYPDWKIINDSGKTIKVNILPEYSDEIMIGECRSLPGPGAIFRRSAAIKIKGRRTNWRYVGDYDFWLRLSRIGKIRRIPGILAQWRESQTSTSISHRGLEMAIERIEVTSNFLSENVVPKNITKMAIGNSYYLAARLAFFDSRIKGRNYLIKSIWYFRGWPNSAKLHIVIYLLLLPFSKKLLDKFPKLVTRITQR